MLRRLKAGQSIKEIGPTWHMSKQGTPTMGGLIFIIGIAVAMGALGWKDFTAGRFGGAFVFLFALVFGIIGYIDDYFKVKKKQNTGLTAPQKFLLQLAASIVFTVLMRNHGYLTHDLYIPFVNVSFKHSLAGVHGVCRLCDGGHGERGEYYRRHRRPGHRGDHAGVSVLFGGGLLLG